MKTKLQAVEEKIRELCPELMELSFGCKARLKYGDHIMTLVGSDAYFYQFAYDFLKGKVLLHKTTKTFWKKDDKELFNDNCGGFEIIGHDITLEHVLKVIGKTWRKDFNCGVNSTGHLNLCWEYETDNSGEEPKVSIVSWQLGAPLHLQKPEVIDFLYQIFKLNEDE